MKKKILVMLVVLLCSTAAWGQGTELLKNTSFQQTYSGYYPKYWSVQGALGYVSLKGEGPPGELALLLQNYSGGSCSISQTIDNKIGSVKTYTGKVQIKLHSGALDVRYKIETGGRTYVGYWQTIEFPGSYIEMDIAPFTVATASSSAKLTLEFTRIGGSFFQIDNVSLKQYKHEGKIAFTAGSWGNRQIHVMNADGTGLRQVTWAAGDNSDPLLSPDESKIAFKSWRDGPKAEIYVVNVDGTNERRLTNNDEQDGLFSWHPNSYTLVYESNEPRHFESEIWKINVDGTGKTRLTDNLIGDRSPRFSPDGSMIAFSSERYMRDDEIWVMDAEGNNPIDVSNDLGFRDTDPKWSPDGTEILYRSTYFGSQELCVLTVDQSVPIRCPVDDVVGASFDWAPDGEYLAFISAQDGNNDIFRIRSDGEYRVNLTDSATGEDSLAYSPSGGFIGFVSSEDGSPDVHVMDAMWGDNEVALTNGLGVIHLDW